MQNGQTQAKAHNHMDSNDDNLSPTTPRVEKLFLEYALLWNVILDGEKI